ncbi:MAG: hypothetical protein NZM37_08260 [Sandaracinaceae bacterium]|nr:hypothetical protein [Sandaracinaceae bacterium]MDW8246583.1 hypothetical protein [Sandaracinaceae bacterium]
MMKEHYLAAVPTRVRQGAITCHMVHLVDEDASVFVAFSLMGLPRFGPLILPRVLTSACNAFQSARASSLPDRLVHVIGVMRQEMLVLCGQLIELIQPDLAVALMGIDSEGMMHVLSTGPCRVYVFHQKVPERLTPREGNERGIVGGGKISHCTKGLELPSIVFGGSDIAFSSAAVESVGCLLEQRASPSPQELVGLLLEPAMKAGVGGAAFALRITGSLHQAMR